MRKKNLLNFCKGLLFIFLWTHSLGIFAQNITVSGTVNDDTGLEVIGATVIVSGDTSKGTVTDMDGKYILTDVPSNASLVFSYVGMKNQIVPVNGRSTIDITLVTDAELLDELVVTALGMSRDKKALGYSMTELKGEELMRSNSVNPINALQGKVAGVQINMGAGGPQSSQRILIRGNTSISGNNQPIFCD